MSDDEFDDSFFADDSFLRQVDDLTAQACASTAKTSKLTFDQLSKPSHATFNASAGPSRRSTAQPTLGSRRAYIPPPPIANSTNRVPIPPSSDDYGDVSLEEDSLAAIDAILAKGARSMKQPDPKLPSVQPGRIGSSFSRIPLSNLSRSSSGKGEGFLQTHLNFKRDNQVTRGKRWDRTMFAETGRRLSVKPKGAAAKGEGKGKERAYDDDDDEEDEEDDWGEPLAPNPRPLVDNNRPYETQKHSANTATIGTYIYPTNRSRREYQYEIVRACFTDNCLVALPTGLGKTFIAGVVMLNFYRWFPTGKIVFLAPTRPLVNQQIEACQLACGIPSAAAAVMTGQSVSAKERAKLWDEKRVFYCTPQTLDNDLKKGSVDPRDIVLAVFDEAHKASGSYAYTTILAYITAHHPYFRVLALTATPGADVPKVQAVVDALHISRIEIREAEAPEIRKYMNEKRTEKHFLQMNNVIAEFRDRWAALMKPYIGKLVQKDILKDRDMDATRLRTFRLTALRMEIMRDRNSVNKWCLGSLSMIEKMTRAMGHLLEFSLGMFHTALLEIAGQTKTSGKKGNSRPSATSIRSNVEFQRLLRDVEEEMNDIRAGRNGKTIADRHPKMQKTLELLLAYFAQAAEDEEQHGIKNDTRAMVFCSYRECVLEVVDMLNQHPDLLRATKFVGQSQGKQEGDKGFNQKEQKKTINEFKEGKFNILVATSIGEEGLDIGEVDFVVIYDMPKQSIKLLQRIGRTGRKRNGHVHVLMSEGREDANWDKAQTTHREIQEEILHSRNLELFEDVEPLIPRSPFPTCVEQEMPVDPWDPEDQKTRKKLATAEQEQNRSSKLKPSETKGKVQRGHEVPQGAEGFKSVSALLKEKGKAKALKRSRKIESDKEETEVESDFKTRKRKTYQRVIDAMKSRSADEDREELRRKKVSKKPKRVHSYHSDEEGEILEVFENPRIKIRGEDEDESEDEFNVLEMLYDNSSSKNRTMTKTIKVVGSAFLDDFVVSETKSNQSDNAFKSPKPKLKLRSKAFDDKPDNFISTDTSSASGPQSQSVHYPVLPREHRSGPRNGQGSIDFLNKQELISHHRALTPLETPPSSPPDYVPNAQIIGRRSPSPSFVMDSKDVGGEGGRVTRDGMDERDKRGKKLSPRLAAAVGFSQIDDLIWNDDDDDFLLDTPPNQRRIGEDAGNNTSDGHRNTNFDNMNIEPTSHSDLRPQRIQNPSSLNHSKSTDIMPPPPVPLTILSSSPVTSKCSSAFEPTQFPVRRPGQRNVAAARTIVTPSSTGSDAVEISRGSVKPGRSGRELGEHESEGYSVDQSPIVQLNKLRRRVETDSQDEMMLHVETPQRQGRNEGRSRRKRLPLAKVKQFLDVDAEVSEEELASSDEPLSDIESESDRLFANNFQPTQAPVGYDQHAMYVAGLSTQTASRAGFSFKKDDRQAEFMAKARRPVYITDDEDDEGSEGHGRGQGGIEKSTDNEYELGSFVVDDDDIVYATQSDPQGSGW